MKNARRLEQLSLLYKTRKVVFLVDTVQKLGVHQQSFTELERTSYTLLSSMERLRFIDGQVRVISFNGEMRNQLVLAVENKEADSVYF
jgi:hypothetical protein